MSFRMMTYNIHKCVGGLDRVHDPARIAESISHYDPDIVLLQEVLHSFRQGKVEDQSELLGERLRYRHRAFFPHVARRNGGLYGNAILSRHPITDIRHVDLTVALKKRRGALHARIRLPMSSGALRTLHVYNLHLGLSGIERKLQLRRFLAGPPFTDLHSRAPVVIGGDFNDFWGTLGRKILEPAGFIGPARRLFTFPAFAPVRALDAFYVRGDMRISSIIRGHLKSCRQASDHLPVIADCRFGSKP